MICFARMPRLSTAEQDALIVENQWIVCHMAKKMQPEARILGKEQFKLIGNEALVLAARKYRTELGTFVTMACVCIQRNITRAARKEHARGKARELEPETVPDERDRCEELDDTDEFQHLQNLLSAAILLMPPEFGDALRWKYGLGCAVHTYDEIAERAQIRPSTAVYRVQKAVELAKAGLDRP